MADDVKTMMDRVMQEDWMPSIHEAMDELKKVVSPEDVDALENKLDVVSHSMDGGLARIRAIERNVDKLLDRVTILEAKMDELSGISERIAKLEETTALNDFI